MSWALQAYQTPESNTKTTDPASGPDFGPDLMSKLTLREQEHLLTALRCVKSGHLNVDIEKFQVATGLSSIGAARARWIEVKKKVFRDVELATDNTPGTSENAAESLTTNGLIAFPHSGSLRVTSASLTEQSIIKELATMLFATLYVSKSADESARSAYQTATIQNAHELLERLSDNPRPIIKDGEKQAADFFSKYERKRELREWTKKATAINDIVESLKGEEQSGNGPCINSPGQVRDAEGVATGNGRTTRGGISRKRKELEDDLIKNALELGQMAKKAKESKKIWLGSTTAE